MISHLNSLFSLPNPAQTAMKTSLFPIVLLLVSLFFSCESPKENRRETLTEVEKMMDLQPFSKLYLSGLVNVVLTQSDREYLEISGVKELVDLLEIRQTGETLSLSLKNSDINIDDQSDLEVRIYLKDISELEFEGAGLIKSSGLLSLNQLMVDGKGVGDIRLELEAESLEISLNFVGNMELKGTVQEFSILNEGVGNIDASQLIAQKVTLESKGIGAVSVHAEQELSLEVSGIGMVSYKGNPTIVYENVSGIGKVNRN